MAEQSEKIADLAKPFGEVTAADPELAAVLSEMGFEDADPTKTLEELAAEAGVDLSIVGLALGAAGYDVRGYVPTEDAKNDPLESLINEMSKTEPLAAGGSADPMVAHMEYAIRRAKARGEL